MLIKSTKEYDFIFAKDSFDFFKFNAWQMPTPNAGITVNALQEVITLNIKPAKNTPTNNPLKLLGHFKIHQYAILLNKPHSSKMFVRIYALKQNW